MLFDRAGEMLERWRLMPVDMRRSSGYMLHVSVFWWQILLRPQEKSPTTHWAMAVGFLDAKWVSKFSLIYSNKLVLLYSGNLHVNICMKLRLH